MLPDSQKFDTHQIIQVHSLLLMTWQELYQGLSLVLRHLLVPSRMGSKIMLAKALSTACLLFLTMDTSP